MMFCLALPTCLLAEDQQDGTPQHFNRHTATWRKPEQEGHKAVP